MLFSIVAVPIYIPTNNAQWFPHPHSCLFDNSQSNRCEMMTYCGIDVYFPDG